MSAAPLLPDRDQLARFVEALFRHADRSGFLALRVFGGGGAGDVTLYDTGVRLDDPNLVDRIAEMVAKAATVDVPAVFAPPVATFSNAFWARAIDLHEGVAIVIECDEHPASALAVLGQCLGRPTLVVQSGGLWTDPESGATEPKLHAYWRLATPARTLDELQDLRVARRLACDLVGADRTAVPLVHPLRWPGSWHRKGTPRLARIVDDNDVEIDLADALAKLRAIPDTEFARKPSKSARAAPNPNKMADPVDVAAALEAIPNENVTWEEWNRIGMATWLATGGDSGPGFLAFNTWSEKSSKYDPAATEERWDHYFGSPPEEAGAGTLFYLARKADPTWIKPSARSDAARWFQEPVNADDDFHMPLRDESNVPVISEDEAGIQFAEEYRDKLRFSVAHGRWFMWDGNIWRENTTNLAFTLTREHIRRMAADRPEKVRIAAGKAAFAGAVERYARADRAFAVTADAWDRDPMLLGTPRGTVDLRTGELRPARPEDGITRSTAVAPADRADCPLWLRFLSETFASNAAMIAFAQSWGGYCLTGLTREHALVFGHGDGGNGKSVYVNVHVGIAGDYATTASMDTFIASHGDRHSTDLAMLRGARLVTASETEEGRQWAESRIKQLTGGDRISARFMRQDFFTFTPTFKLLIIGNHKPGLRNVDAAAKRRFNLVPFANKPATKDLQLEEKLKAEWPAILRWLIDGCLAWQRNGLKPPESVREATAAYFQEQDVLGEWLIERCVVDRGNDFRQAATAELFASWTAFAKAANEPVGTERSFSQRLEREGFTRKARVQLFGGSRVRGFSGIEIRRDTTQCEAAE